MDIAFCFATVVMSQAMLHVCSAFISQQMKTVTWFATVEVLRACMQTLTVCNITNSPFSKRLLAVTCFATGAMSQATSAAEVALPG